ncbi:hypothetical protein BH09ACT10_BH09ACT10_03070 [soil metagenome]
MSARPDDEFDKIVEGLDLDLNFEPFEEPEAEAPVAEIIKVPDETPDDSELHDWEVHEPPAELNARRLVGWSAVLGGPALLIVATVFDQVLPRTVAFAAVMAFVAGAVYLVLQLPDHGPGRPDWPDDGAVL